MTLKLIMAHSQLNLRRTVPSSIACIYDSNLNKYYQKQRKGNTNGGKALDKKNEGYGYMNNTNS